MKKNLLPTLGLYGVYLGVLVLLLGHLTGWNRLNALLFTGLGLIIAGIVLFILSEKRNSQY